MSMLQLDLLPPSGQKSVIAVFMKWIGRLLFTILVKTKGALLG